MSKIGNFFKEHPFITTSYFFLLLFANMFGFWSPFKVNIFTFVGVTDTLIYALQFVGESVLAFLVYASITTSALLFIASLVSQGGFFRYLLTALLLSLAPLSVLMLCEPYSVWGFLVLAAIALSTAITCGIQLPKNYLIFLVIALPIYTYITASHNAFSIIKNAPDAGVLVDINVPVNKEAKGTFTYLGHAGEYFILYENTTRAVLIKRLPPEAEIKFTVPEGKNEQIIGSSMNPFRRCCH